MFGYKKIFMTALLALITQQVQAQVLNCSYGATIYQNPTCLAGANAAHVSAIGSIFHNQTSSAIPLYMTSNFSNVTAVLEGITAEFTIAASSVNRLIHITAGNGNNNGRGLIQFKGVNTLRNTLNGGGGVTGEAAIYIDANKDSAKVELLAGSSLTIEQMSEKNYNGVLSFLDDGAEAIYLSGNVSNTLNASAASELFVANDATLDITAKGSAILLDSRGGSQPVSVPLKAHILSTNSIIRTGTRTSSGEMVGTLLAQTTAGNKAMIDIESNADLRFWSMRPTALNRGGAIVANHKGTAVPATDQSIQIKVGGQQSSTGSAIAGIRAIAQTGLVNIEATSNNLMHSSGLDANGIYFGHSGTSINPTNITVNNHGIIEITGVSGNTNNAGIVVLAHNSPINLNNTGDIYLREQTNGFAIKAIHNPQAAKNLSIRNAGVLAYEGIGCESGGIRLQSNALGNVSINNSGTIYANKEAIWLDTRQSTIQNTGTIISYLTSNGVSNDTVTNAGIWIAQNTFDLTRVNFDFGTGTNRFNNSGTLTIPNNSAANAIVITPPDGLLPTITTPLTVTDAGADTNMIFNLGVTGVFELGGIVDLQNSTPINIHYNQFIINGDLQANSGELKFDTRIAGDDTAGAHTDFMEVNGDINTTAPVTLTLRNTDGVAAPTVAGIELVRILGSSSGSEFRLGGGNSDGVINTRVISYPYRLFRKPLVGAGQVTQATWLLANTHCQSTPIAPVIGQSATVICYGLDDAETLDMPFLSSPTCIYSYTTDKTISPATGSCTGVVLASDILPAVSVRPTGNGGMPTFPMPNFPYVTGNESVPSQGLISWLSLLGLIPLLAAARRRA